MSRTSSTPPSIHGGSGVLPAVPKNKLLLLSVFSLLTNFVRRYPFFSAAILYACLAGVIAAISRFSYGRDARPAYDDLPYNASGVALIGHGYLIDLIGQTLSIEWEIVGCGEYRLQTWPPVGYAYAAAGCDALDRAVDIYMNNVSQPIFSYDPTVFPSVSLEDSDSGTTSSQPLYVYILNVFDVDHSIDFFAPGMAPFDTYSLSALAFVIDKATNDSVPLITLAAGDGPDNFVISSYNVSTTTNYTYDSGTGPTWVEVDSGVIVMKAKRSQLAKAFTMCLLVINSALTVGSAYVTLLAVVRRERIKEAVILLPVTIVLTIPALRGLYVGSPPFGIFFDTFGLFLQMMTVALCSIILLYIVAKPKA